jgi:hypothetical protein
MILRRKNEYYPKQQLSIRFYRGDTVCESGTEIVSNMCNNIAPFRTT